MSRQSIVLVPADHHTDIGMAVDVAALMAEPDSAEVHVIDVTPDDGSWRASEVGREVEWSGDDDASSSPGTASGSARRTIVRLVRLRGRAADVIPAYARLSGATAIVIDRYYGSGPWWRSGGTALRISRTSPVPVMILPADRRRTERLVQRRIGQIVAPIDFTMASAVAMRTAVTLARQHRARVTMVHSLKGYPEQPVFTGLEAWLVARQFPLDQKAIAASLRRSAFKLGYANVAAQVVTGAAAKAITGLMSDRAADLVVMGVPPRGALDRRLHGSVLDAVVRRASIPVLVVPVAGGASAWRDDTTEPVAVPFPADVASLSRPADRDERQVPTAVPR